MKLDDGKTSYIQSQMDVYAVPESFPALAEMRKVFGDHTYFVGDDGLLVWENLDIDGISGQTLVAVSLADWSDGTKTELSIREPSVTRSVIVIPEDTNGSNV